MLSGVGSAHWRGWQCLSREPDRGRKFAAVVMGQLAVVLARTRGTQVL